MGIINEAIAPQEGSQPAESPPEMSGPGQPSATQAEYTADSVRAQMEIPGDLREAYEKIITAGLKVMFDPTTRKDTLSFINESGGEPAKLAQGVMSVVATLYQQSNGTLPPNLIIPAGIELLVHAADVAKDGGMEVGNDMLAEAMSELVKQTLQKFGASPEQMQKLMSGLDSEQQAPGAAQPAQPMQPGQAPRGV